VAATGMALLGAADSAFRGESLLDPAGSAKLAFTSTLFFGAIPAVTIGAPIYVALLLRDKTRWLYVILLGITPGILALPFDVFLGILGIACGAFVGSLTHLACRRLGPNNSFKPNALRSTSHMAG